MNTPQKSLQMQILEAAERGESTSTQPAVLLCWAEEYSYIERVGDVMSLTEAGANALHRMRDNAS